MLLEHAWLPLCERARDPFMLVFSAVLVQAPKSFARLLSLSLNNRLTGRQGRGVKQ